MADLLKINNYFRTSMQKRVGLNKISNEPKSSKKTTWYKDVFIIFIYLLSGVFIFEQSILFKLFLITCLIVGSSKRMKALYRFKYFKIKYLNLFLIFLFLFSITVLRSNNDAYPASYIFFKYMVFVLLCFYLCLLCFDVCLIKKIDVSTVIRNLVIYPFAIFCLLNLFLYFSGITVKNLQAVEDINGYNEATVLAALGIPGVERVQFALVSGFNSFGTVIGIMLTLSGVLYLVGTGRRIFNMISFFIFLVTLLLIDTRASIYFPLLIFILVFFLFKYGIKPLFFAFKIVPYLYIIVPLLMFFIIPIFSSLGISFISRGNESLDSDFVRFVIWGLCINDLSSFSFMHLIGYGEFGPYGAGVSVGWQDLFKSWISEKYITPHNSVISLIFDGGYLLLILFLLLNQKIVTALLSKDRKRPELYIFGAFYIYCAIIGSSESIIGLYFPNFLFYFIFLTFLFIFYNSVKKLGHNTNYSPIVEKQVDYSF